MIAKGFSFMSKFSIIQFFFIPIFLYSNPFKIASYNIQNLFDMQKSGLEYKEYLPNEHNWTKATLDIKLNHIADVLCDINADIVALQEVENQNILDQLGKKLKRVGCKYPYNAITHNKHSSIQVALLSRYKLTNIQELSIKAKLRDRPILEATALIDGIYPLILFVNHWKAKSRNGVESRRLEYAKQLMKRIDSLSREQEYIILGDLNSQHNEYQAQNQKFNDTNGIIGINHILKTLYNNLLVDEELIVKGLQGIHYNLWLELLSSQRWSHQFYAHKSSLDHILLPTQLFDSKGIDYVNNSFAVFKPRYLFNNFWWINRWVYSENTHKGIGYSDHLPIYALFDTKPFIKQKPKSSSISTINKLYKVEKIEEFIELKNVVVLLQRGKYAVIKQSATTRAILVYNISQKLEQGGVYDITIDEVSSYKGLKEIIGVTKSQKVKTTQLKEYYLHSQNLDYQNPLLQNEVFINLEGVYKEGYFYTNNQKIPLYFKRKKLTPKNGTKLKILYAHLGYYRKPQLVIYNQKDFILEK